MDANNIIVDGIKWIIWIDKFNLRRAQSLCPKHHLRLSPFNGLGSSSSLKCDECKTLYRLPRTLREEEQYVLNKVDSRVFKGLKYINLDDEAIPLAESKISSKDSNYFVTGLITESKVGKRLVIYAGKKGKLEKTQIFVEPDIKRLAFDQNDLHPSDVFTIVEAIFEDGTISKIESGKKVMSE